MRLVRVALALGAVVAACACGGAPREHPSALIASRTEEARDELERGHHERAETLLREALALAERSGAPGSRVEPRLGMALLARYRKDAAAVQSELARTRDDLVPSTPAGVRGRIDLLEATLALDASAPDRAVRHAESARALCAEARDARCQVDALVALANALGLFEANYEEARAAIEACVGAAREAEDPGLGLRCVNARAHLAYNLADYASAVRDYSLLTTSGSVLPDRIRAAASLNLALCRIHLGMYGSARLAIEEAIAAAREPGRTEYPLAVPLYYRGYLLSRLGDVEGALEDFGAALAMFRELGNLYYESFVLVDVGDMLLTRGFPERARVEYERSLEIHRRAGNRRGLMLGDEGIGRCLLAEGDVAGAEARLRSALRRAEEIGDDHGWARIAVVLGDRILRVSARAQARALLLRAREVGHRAGLLEEELRATTGIARWHRDAGDDDRALFAFFEALDLLDRIRGRLQSESQHLAFSDARDAVYREAVDLALAAPEAAVRLRGIPAAALAFEIAERGRARALVEIQERSRIALAARSADVRRAHLAILARVSRAQTRVLAAADGERASAREELQAAREALELHELSQGAHMETARASGPVTLEAARNLPAVGSGTLAVYWLGSDRSLVWRIRSEGATVLELGPYAEIATAVEEYRASIGVEPGWDNPPERWRSPARRLARLLRIAEVLPGPDGSRPGTLLIAPDGPLHGIPLGPLLLDDEGSDPPPMLADVADVVVVPSASFLDRSSPPALARPMRLLALGDPDRSDVPSLKGAREEAQRIASLFPVGDADVRVGAAATESVLRGDFAARADILHLAARAVVSDERPEATGLALAADDEDDGFVRLEELAGLDLRARIAVLSACRTGLGRPVAGEGLQGLARAFLVAGVPVVVPSFWDVSDRATAKLMEAFYRRLLNGEHPHRALADASRELRRSEIALYAHPHYWAAFVHLGSPIAPL